MDSPKVHSLSETNPIAERILRPRYLCFLREEGTPAKLLPVEEWISKHKYERNLSYVFVAYTREQFGETKEDYKALDQIAEAAARNAGVEAYWIGHSCMPDEDQLQDDVSRMVTYITNTHTNRFIASVMSFGGRTH